MKIELKKLRKPDGSIWFAVKVDDAWQMPFYTEEAAARKQYDNIIKTHSEGLPAEETLLSETL